VISLSRRAIAMAWVAMPHVELDRHLPLPSGRRYGSIPSLPTAASRSAKPCERDIGNRMSDGVSFVAHPNISP
jgi:hypothetical protein